MSKYNGITDDTYKRFLIDAGAVYIGFTSPSNLGTLLGATRGGNSFVIETEIKNMQVDGAPGRVKGDARIVKSNASMKIKLVEITTAALLLALPGATSAAFPVAPGTATHDQIKRALTIALADYKTAVALVGEVAGQTDPMIFVIKNVLATGGIEIGATDGEEATIEITLNAYYDPAALTDEPWEILRPKEAA